MTIWFSSDLHLEHAAVIKYSNRPFEAVGEMNEGLIHNWNQCVKPNDRVFFLGDLIFGKVADQDQILNRLNGKITLIAGNHDHGLVERIRKGKCARKFENVYDYYELKDNKEKFVLCHYPLERWNRFHYGAWHLHGHSHGRREATSLEHAMRRLDVGVDVHNYFPISLDDVRSILSPRTGWVGDLDAVADPEITSTSECT